MDLPALVDDFLAAAAQGAAKPFLHKDIQLNWQDGSRKTVPWPRPQDYRLDDLVVRRNITFVQWSTKREAGLWILSWDQSGLIVSVTIC